MIPGFRNVDGDVHDVLLVNVHRFFNFSNNLSLPGLGEDEQQAMDAPISQAEVAEALKALNNGSAPGSDGIPAEWYKLFWQHIREPLLELLQVIFSPP